MRSLPFTAEATCLGHIATTCGVDCLECTATALDITHPGIYEHAQFENNINITWKGLLFQTSLLLVSRSEGENMTASGNGKGSGSY